LILPLLALLSLTASAAACQRGPTSPDQAPTFPVGTSEQVITVQGQERTFRIHRPATLPAAAPLVLMLHGGFGTGEQAEQAYGWSELADREQFVVAYPDGRDRAWNAGGTCCGKPAERGDDDVAFLTALVDTIGARLSIDPARVYSTGMSNGGLMSYRLACDTTLFAAIGPVAGTLLGECDGAAPISVLHIHGTEDTRVRYLGGVGEGVAKIDGPAIPALNAQWRATANCAAPTLTTEGLVATSIATCPNGRTVELISIAGAGHQWPGSERKPALERLLDVDPPSPAVDATQALWAFFKAHPKSA
jgi:polyhydroxybutyrate depolymerase